MWGSEKLSPKLWDRIEVRKQEGSATARRSVGEWEKWTSGQTPWEGKGVRIKGAWEDTRENGTKCSGLSIFTLASCSQPLLRNAAGVLPQFLYYQGPSYHQETLQEHGSFLGCWLFHFLLCLLALERFYDMSMISLNVNTLHRQRWNKYIFSLFLIFAPIIFSTVNVPFQFCFIKPLHVNLTV